MSLSIQQNKSLDAYTTLKVGGEAEYFVEVDTVSSLEEAVVYAKEHNLRITILGGGSNVLVSDNGVSGLVIYIVIKGIETTVDGPHVQLTVSAGEVLDDIVYYAVNHGYWGLENLSHIPGTAGAAPVQNVGAYGVEVKNLITSVQVYNTETNLLQTLTSEQCQFGYRNSIFKTSIGAKYIVVSVTVTLSTIPNPRVIYKDLQSRFHDREPTIQEVRDAVIDIRATKFPNWYEVGTAGSFFKNPVVSDEKFKELRILYPELPGFSTDNGDVKIPLGWVLDKVLHLKGEGTDNVGTYKNQALVLINRGYANANDFSDFAEHIIMQVYTAIGVEVQWEVTKLG